MPASASTEGAEDFAAGSKRRTSDLSPEMLFPVWKLSGLLLVSLHVAADQLSPYTGQDDVQRNTRLQMTPLKTLTDVGFTLCGRKCRQEVGCRSYNYHRAGGSCQCLGLTSAESPEDLVSAEDWFHGNITNIEEASYQNCSCRPDLLCSVTAPSALRCPERATLYNVTVFTGINPGGVSATGVAAFVTLYGEYGAGGETQIIDPENRFDVGSQTSATASGPDLGPLTLLKVEVKGTTSNPWYVDQVVVARLDELTLPTIFPFYDTMGTGEDDATVAYLSPF